MADTVEGLVKQLKSLIVRNPDGSFVTETDAALSEAASALQALVVERDEARRIGKNNADLWHEACKIADEARARALAAEAQRAKLAEALWPFIPDGGPIEDALPDAEIGTINITLGDVRRARSTLNEIAP